MFKNRVRTKVLRDKKSPTRPLALLAFTQRSPFKGLSSRVLRPVSKQALNILLPPQCPISGDPVSEAGEISGAGWQAMQFIESPFCDGCAIPFSVDHGDDIKCAHCLADAQRFQTARASIVYDDISHPLIVGFKHGDRTELAPMFAKWMVRAGRDLLRPDVLLMPVPLHHKRLRARRFNQSALLTKEIAALTGHDYCLDGVERHRPTPPQQKLSSEGRKRNVAGAFRVDEEKQALFKGKHVILIDDVLTTGATISACCGPLLAAGASQVDALVLARVVKGGRQAI